MSNLTLHLGAQIEGLEREIKEIDATIEDLVAKKSKRVGPTGVQIDVVIGLDVAGTIELKLTYSKKRLYCTHLIILHPSS